MKRYYYKAEYREAVTKSYRKRGYNKLITVYEMNKDGRFTFIGDQWINTASYRGDDAIASQILHDEKNYQWGDTGTHYYLKRKDIQIILLP